MGLIGLIAELAVLGSIAAGIAANAAVVGTCKMLELRNGAGNIGPWRADIDGSGCQGWNKDETDQDDWILNMARACSVMALIFGCILAVFGFFNQCLCPLPCSQKILDLSGVGVQIGLALTWPMIRSSVCDNHGGCRWGDDAAALLLSQIFYLAASIFNRCMREPRYKRRQEERQEEPEPEKDLEQNETNGSGTEAH
ncbi:expressed unknown protein [Seminavis robusta]|uniref:Uncharacterized protein n=1 Tax=Seminavis robusta TaxID=568900 RepID=A0A9N8D8N1_9STRA|nr:expressed unknown protein [Seminavis robusta]|eukprot:Sro2_g001770.1 n/a (197) ;mRNA; r:243772-244362